MKYQLGLLILILGLTSCKQSTQELEVKGYGRLKTQPDLGVLHIDLTTIQKEFGTTVTVLSEEYEKMVIHLANEGFKKEEIKTSNYGVRENRVYRRQMFYDSGFVGHQSLLLEFPNTKENLTKITQSFAKSPVKAKFSFSFTISDNKRDEIRNELIKKAINDAQQKASLIAESSGRKLGKIRSITYGTTTRNSFDFESTYDHALMIEVPDEEVINEQIGFDIKEISFKDNVTIIFELK